MQHDIQVHLATRILCSPVHDELPVVEADAARPLEKDAFDAAQLFGRLLNAFLKFLPDARHAEKHRRAALADRIQKCALQPISQYTRSVNTTVKYVLLENYDRCAHIKFRTSLSLLSRYA